MSARVANKCWQPVLARFLPGIRKKTDDVNESAVADQKKKTILNNDENTQSPNITESTSANVNGKPKIELKPVVSKFRKENASRHIPSLIKPAIDTSKKESTGSLLGNPGGANGDFLSSFGRESTTTVPGTKTGGLKVGRGKPDLTPVSASANKALTLLPKIVVSEGVFLLSDFCIDNMSSSAADLIDQIERCRDRVSLQAVIKEIHAKLNPNDKTKMNALFKTVEGINATV